MYYNIKMTTNIIGMCIYSMESMTPNFRIFSIFVEWIISVNKSSELGVLIIMCEQKTKMYKYTKENIIVFVWMNMIYYKYLHLYKC